MKLIANKKLKRIYLFEIVGFLVLPAIVVIGVYFFILNPKYKIIEENNSIREGHLESILTAIDKYINNDEGAYEFLYTIEFCGEGWSEIGKDPMQVDLFSVLVPNYLESSITDPDFSDKVGYDICRSFDTERFQLRAPYAESKTIIIGDRFEYPVLDR